VKMMATFHERDGGWRIAVKGAPESVLEASTRFGLPETGRGLDSAGRRHWLEQSGRLAAEGFRVLAVAAKAVDTLDAEPYEGLSLLGLIGLEDPPRADVADSVRVCGRAGIDVVMVTGDHPATAGKVAGMVGIADPDSPRVME